MARASASRRRTAPGSPAAWSSRPAMPRTRTCPSRRRRRSPHFTLPTTAGPDLLPDGPVLVVGAGATGQQLALELSPRRAQRRPVGRAPLARAAQVPRPRHLRLARGARGLRPDGRRAARRRGGEARAAVPAQRCERGRGPRPRSPRGPRHHDHGPPRALRRASCSVRGRSGRERRRGRRAPRQGVAPHRRAPARTRDGRDSPGAARPSRRAAHRRARGLRRRRVGDGVPSCVSVSASRRRARPSRRDRPAARRDAGPRAVRARPRVPVPTQLALHRRRRSRCRDDRRSGRRPPCPAASAAARVAADRGGGARRAPAPARGVTRGGEAPASDRRPVRGDRGGPERLPGLQRLCVARAHVPLTTGRRPLRRGRHRRAAAERRRRRRSSRLRPARRPSRRPCARLLRAARIPRAAARRGRA